MPHNFVAIGRKVDTFRKGTILDPLDEPTYLTFSLDFKFERSNVSGTSEVNEDRLWNSPLLHTGDNGDNATKFLERRGYEKQADGLNSFIGLLSYLTNTTPWYFQSISGLGNLYSSATDVSKEIKANKAAIEIETLEAVDLRMSELAGLYRNAIYDLRHRRERVPDNLRWFSMDVYIAEFRRMRYNPPPEVSAGLGALGINTNSISNLAREANNALGAIGLSQGLESSLTGVLAQFGYIKFRCRQCEFDFSGSLPTSGKVSVGGRTMDAEKSKFKINIGYFEEESKYGTGTLLHEDHTKLGTKIKNPWFRRSVGETVESAARFANDVTGGLTGDYLSSVGDSIKDNAVARAINGGLKSATDFIGQDNVKDLGKVYPENDGSSSNPPVDDLGDVYP